MKFFISRENTWIPYPEEAYIGGFSVFYYINFNTLEELIDWLDRNPKAIVTHRRSSSIYFGKNCPEIILKEHM